MKAMTWKARWTAVKEWVALRLPWLGSERIGAAVGLIVLIVVFSVLSAPFRQMNNLLLLSKTTAITIGIIAVGQTVVLISGGIDLSVGSIIGLTGLITALLMKYGFGPIPPLQGYWCYLAILIGWLIGLLIGALQGWVISRWHVPAFILTLGSMIGLRGLSLAISGGAVIYGLPKEFKWFSDGHIAFLPAPVLIMLVVYLLSAYMLRRTKVGRYCYAIGGNETAARLAGIDADRYRVIFYAYSGLLAGMTGTILISFIDAGIYSNGEGFQFNSLAAAIIGGNSLTGGVGGVWGTLVGSFILSIIPSGLIMLNAPGWWRDVVTAVVIILAVIIDINRHRSRKKVIQTEVSQPPLPVGGHYLNEILGRLAQKVEKYTGSPFCRVYLIDRDTGDPVPQELLASKSGDVQPMLLGKSKIICEVIESGHAVLIKDLGRNGYQRVMPMSPDVQSVLALPLQHDDRCIGVIEVQSPVVGAFREETVETLETLARPMLVGLENAWLFESGWLERQTRDALRHLWDDLYLGRIPLAEWALDGSSLPKERTSGARGETLRNLLLQTIESMKPQDEHDPARSGRSYRLLRMTYVEEQAVDQILRGLHISRRQYFYDLKDSVEVLTDMLVRNHRA